MLKTIITKPKKSYTLRKDFNYEFLYFKPLVPLVNRKIIFHAIKCFKFNLKHHQFRTIRNERSVPRKTLNICHQKTAPGPRLPRAIVNKHTGKQTVRLLSLSLFQETLVRSILTENKQSPGLCYSHHALLKQSPTIWRGFSTLKTAAALSFSAAVSLELDRFSLLAWLFIIKLE